MLYLTLYDDVFFVVLTLLLTFAAVKFRLRNIPNYHLVAFFEAFLILLVTLLASWFISTRPAEIEGDTSVYLDFYETVVNGTGHPFAIFEPGFAVITLFLSEMGLDLRVLFFVVPLLLSLSYHRLAVRVFGIRSSMTVMVFACILIYPFFLSLTANVIRQGLAMTRAAGYLQAVRWAEMAASPAGVGVLGVSQINGHPSAVGVFQADNCQITCLTVAAGLDLGVGMLGVRDFQILGNIAI